MPDSAVQAALIVFLASDVSVHLFRAPSGAPCFLCCQTVFLESLQKQRVALVDRVNAESGRAKSGALIHQGFQAIDVENADMFLLYGDVSFFLEAGKGTGHGFQLESKVAADFFPGHAQVELRM